MTEPEKGFRLMQLTLGKRPMTRRGWINLIMGFDIWLGPLPFLRTVVIANLIMWVLLWVLS